MKFPPMIHILLFGLVGLLLFSSVTAVAATNTIPTTRLDHVISSINVNDFKPPTCAGLSLTSLVTGTGALNGTAGNDLILGGPNADTISGVDGNDCIIGGGGIDIITGGNGTDVCIGGPGIDIFLTCETQIQ